MAVANGGFLTDETEVMDRRVLVENEWNQGRAPEQRAETSHSLFEEDDIRNGRLTRTSSSSTGAHCHEDDRELEEQRIHVRQCLSFLFFIKFQFY
ncbi:hypothetical protein WR25_01869 [Diploscapter pachys]|uniref:Uncharacterized protein n=1 Tax=Diploscapter pachys TaxID=2018661 RepID=A0A2A2KW86_9BILA|nr:hypothetical protein WR25_01869 [Diploscapter pachys]